MSTLDLLRPHLEGLVALRRDLHAHPELCFDEHRTSERVAQALGDLGIPTLRGLGGTGVVGIVHGRDGGACGRAVGLRADIDALPMTEANRFAHASTYPGRMHACGHDGHTAMLLGAATILAARRDFDGTVYLIFQPAEEGGGGARRMIEDGLFERCPVEAVFGLHNWPGVPTGTLAVTAGPVLASSNEFTVTVRGKGAHAALPYLGVDPVVVACQIVLALQTIVSRNVKPIDAAVVSTTMVRAGEATNVIPDHCTLRGTVRTFRLDVLDLIERRLREIVEHTCAAAGATADLQFDRNYPPTVNSAAEAAFAAEVMRDLVGAERVGVQEPTMGAEDFAYMLQVKPGAYAWIGNGDGGHRGSYGAGHDAGPCTLHHPRYDFDDDNIPVGAAYWVALATRWLGQPR